MPMNLWAMKANSAPTSMGNTRYINFRDFMIDNLSELEFGSESEFELWLMTTLSMSPVVLNEEDSSLCEPVAVVLGRCC